MFFLWSYSEKCDQYIPLWETLALRFVNLKVVWLIFRKCFLKEWLQLSFHLKHRRVLYSFISLFLSATNYQCTSNLFTINDINNFVYKYFFLIFSLKQHKIVAIINIDTSPLLKARFSIKKCPEAILLALNMFILLNKK